MVESTGLENRRAARYRGFESHSLRQFLPLEGADTVSAAGAKADYWRIIGLQSGGGRRNIIWMGHVLPPDLPAERRLQKRKRRPCLVIGVFIAARKWLCDGS